MSCGKRIEGFDGAYDLFFFNQGLSKDACRSRPQNPSKSNSAHFRVGAVECGGRHHRDRGEHFLSTNSSKSHKVGRPIGCVVRHLGASIHPTMGQALQGNTRPVGVLSGGSENLECAYASGVPYGSQGYSSKKDQQWANVSHNLCSCLTTRKCAPRPVRKANVTYASQTS